MNATNLLYNEITNLFHMMFSIGFSPAWKVQFLKWGLPRRSNLTPSARLSSEAVIRLPIQNINQKINNIYIRAADGGTSGLSFRAAALAAN